MKFILSIFEFIRLLTNEFLEYIYWLVTCKIFLQDMMFIDFSLICYIERIFKIAILIFKFKQNSRFVKELTSRFSRLIISLVVWVSRKSTVVGEISLPINRTNKMNLD